MDTLALSSAPHLQRKPLARPFLKWAGGKGQLLGEILSRFPQTFRCYHEPFLGGGAVFFALQPPRAVLSDINPELIKTYQAIRDDVGLVIQALQAHRHCKEHYYRVRAQDSTALKMPQRAARMIYLNRTCFNGLYRVNQNGQFNVPYGRHVNPTICNTANLKAVSKALRKVDLRLESVFEIEDRVHTGDLVYLDPPYDPLSVSASFTHYATFRFGRKEQVQLAGLFTCLAQRGVHVVLSNSDTPLVRDLYKAFRIHQVRARRCINSCTQRRGSVDEVVITVC